MKEPEKLPENKYFIVVDPYALDLNDKGKAFVIGRMSDTTKEDVYEFVKTDKFIVPFPELVEELKSFYDTNWTEEKEKLMRETEESSRLINKKERYRITYSRQRNLLDGFSYICRLIIRVKDNKIIHFKWVRSIG